MKKKNREVFERSRPCEFGVKLVPEKQERDGNGWPAKNPPF